MYIIIGLAIGILIWVLTLPNPKDVQDLKRVEIIDAIKLYKAGYENSGFSIGKSGMRSYYRRKNRYIGTDIKFRVTYNTGRTATVTAREGTERCNTLLTFMENQDKCIVEKPNITPVRSAPSAPKPAVCQLQEDRTAESEAKLVATLSAVSETKKAEGLSTSTKKTPPPKVVPVQQKDVYPAGEYKVGVTIPAGEYAIYSKKKGGSYFEVNRNHNILFNGFAKGVQLIELCVGDYFEFTDATVQPMADLDLIGMNLPSCSLKVGVHIPPGEYLLTSLNGKDNPISIYSSCRLTDKNMLTFEYVKGNKFVTLQKGNVITYENCKIELVDDELAKGHQSEESIDDISDEEDDFYTQITEEKNRSGKEDVFSDNSYIVGEDMPAGEYVILSYGSKETTIKVRAKGNRKDRVLFTFCGSCILSLSVGDLFDIQYGRALPIDNVREIPKTCKSYMLKVGVHITEGDYVLGQADISRFAVYYILGNSNMILDEALDSDAIFGTVTISLQNGQYIFLENAILDQIT